MGAEQIEYIRVHLQWEAGQHAVSQKFRKPKAGHVFYMTAIIGPNMNVGVFTLLGKRTFVSTSTERFKKLAVPIPIWDQFEVWYGGQTQSAGSKKIALVGYYNQPTDIVADAVLVG